MRRRPKPDAPGSVGTWDCQQLATLLNTWLRMGPRAAGYVAPDVLAQVAGEGHHSHLQPLLLKVLLKVLMRMRGCVTPGVLTQVAGEGHPSYRHHNFL